MRSGWWWFANTVRGDGTETLSAADMPVSAPSVTTTLSGPDVIEFTLTPEIARLKAPDGRPVLRPRGTAVYAVLDGVIRAGGLVRSVSTEGHQAKVHCEGYVSYLDGLPWTSATTRKLYDTDPADVVRLIWAEAQSHPQGNLGLRVPAGLKTSARVGKLVAEVKNKAGEVTTQGVDEPVLLANYATHDLGQVFKEMLEAGSIDYREAHTLSGDTVTHDLVMGAPRLGRRRTDIQLMLGVNVTEVPSVMFDDEDFATEIAVFGAGEGPAMPRGFAQVQQRQDMVRKVQLITSKGIGRQATAQTSAEIRAKQARLDTGDVETVLVHPHPLAPLGSWENGDELWLSGDALWAGTIGMWVRVLSTTWEPGTRPGATLKVVRAERT